MDTPTFRLTQLDAVEWLRSLDGESVDLVITDPPYESLEKHRAVGTTTRLKHSKASSNDWFRIFPNARFEELFRELWRVLRPDTHFYLFCDPETAFVAKPIAERVGFKFWKPLVWDKCLAPDTPVCTAYGVRAIGGLEVGDVVATPKGFATVRAVRKTRAPAVRLSLADGTHIVCSRDHRFIATSGEQIEAANAYGAQLAISQVQRDKAVAELKLDEVIAWRIRFDPVRAAAPITIIGVEEAGDRDLVDISIDDPDELFLLGNGVVTHNCRIGMGYHYRSRYEFVMFFEKGKRKLLDLGIADVIQQPRIVNGYPAEKPVPVSDVLIHQSSEPGMLVVDPFSGSGSVGVAAVKQRRHFAGNDVFAEAIAIARGRLIDAGAVEVAAEATRRQMVLLP